MIKCAHQGPLRVQKPFYFENSSECHVYVLHPPGGFVGNDVLDIRGRLESGANALLTTPAAGKFYRVIAGAKQRQKVTWALQSGASLAWLPQESIYFCGCDAHLQTEFSVSRDSHLFYWDITVLGRQASGERFDHGRIQQDFSLISDGIVQLKERFLLDVNRASNRDENNDDLGPETIGHGDRAPIQVKHWGLGGSLVFATAILSGPKLLPLLGGIQKMVESWLSDDVKAGVTRKNEILIIRYQGPKVSLCKKNFEQLKKLLKTESEVSWEHPRIWNT